MSGLDGGDTLINEILEVFFYAVFFPFYLLHLKLKEARKIKDESIQKAYLTKKRKRYVS
jgi:hypothetical protein